MKRSILAVLTLSLSGCMSAAPAMVDQASVAADPAPLPSTTPTPDPSPSPSPTPSPSPSPSPTPTATPVQTATYGSYSCSLMSDNGVECNGIPISGFSRTGSNGFLQVVVGNGVGCVFEDASGAPAQCGYSDCANPPQNADVQCWTQANPTPVVINGYTQLGFNPSLYSLGPLSMQENPGSMDQVCVTFAVYTMSASPYEWFSNYAACGSAVNSNNLQ